MKAALYARYSTDKQNQATIRVQFDACEPLVHREGFSIIERYRDDGISGSKSARPGYQQMLRDAEAGRFEVLIVYDLSRLTRDLGLQEMDARRLEGWGIRVIGVQDNYDSSRRGSKLQRQFSGIINEAWIDMIRDKTRDGLSDVARGGRSAGGIPFGYRRTDTGKREIDSERARWVRQIFEWFADGQSPRWIAQELNSRGVPSPRDTKWMASAIYGHPQKGTGILNNEIYAGRYIWNRSAWAENPKTGKRSKRTERPRNEWIIHEMPDLEIVPPDLWKRVKARQGQQRIASDQIRTALHTTARTGAAPKFLFSGLLTCGDCGSNFVIVDKYNYGCGRNRNGGVAACGNDVRLSRKVVEDRLLAGIKEQMFTDEALREFTKHLRRALTEQQKHGEKGAEDMRVRLQSIEGAIANLHAAFRDGLGTKSLQIELERLEAERDQLQAQDTGARKVTKIVQLPADLADRFRAMVSDLGKTLQRDVVRARSILRGLLSSGSILIHRNGEAEFSGDWTGLLRASGEKSEGKLFMVAGAGFEPATFGL